ncbi:ABC transporter substrate-binding protein [Anaeromicropila populeti]|uniref:Amino acid ABC transporter substrate-binding protein, PAAT family (TC 3.A.1.3.-) n=1 Tax=Anaeromicropila populeti TaxID=37658 RepID=A0A1I6HMT3_9FIRM|nr:transporter substrate-binding domain-containing protein [Anaeromicropila populeti]SFR55647.1 amino acid ABC transporter substrate-binding protein, PAAT family (TC 3.A.1.3.-) [Anaeromicropila populeti]
MEKWKKAVFIVMIILVAGSLAGCNKETEESKEGGDTPTKDNPKVVEIAILDGMAPYTYQDENGDFQGYDYKFLEKCDELLEEYEFHYNAVDPDAGAAAVQAGTYALSCSAHFVTPAREENFLLSIPQSYYPVNLISRTEDSFTKFEDLDGQVVVPNPPNDGLYVVLYKMAEEFPNVKFSQEEVSEYVSYYDSCKGVANGTWDVWFGGKSMYDDIIAQEPMDLFCSDPVYCADCVVVINKEYEDLRDKLNECIVTLYQDGTLSELSKEWLGMDCFQVAEETGALYDYDSYKK